MPSNKVYLINLPSSFLVNDRVHPPLNLMFLHEHLRVTGVEVGKIVDLAGKEPDDWEIPEDGQIYGISSTTPQYPYALLVNSRVKEFGGKTVLGGSHATALPDDCMKDGFDNVVIGEGEWCMNKIATTDIQGVHMDGVSRLIDQFPFPRMSSLKASDYAMKMTYAFQGRTVEKDAGWMITSRGCPNRCAFCSSYNMWKGRVRFHSIPYLRRWRDYWMERGIYDFYFIDEHVAISDSRLFDVCELMRPIGGYWKAQVRGDAVVRGTPAQARERMRRMYNSGCRQIIIGVESGSQKILDVCNKREEVWENESAIALAHDFGVGVKASVMVGLPGETQEDIDLTAEFLDRTKPDEVGIFVFVPYPGTEIYRKGSFSKEWADYVCVGSDWKTPVFCGAPDEVYRRKKQLMDTVGNRFTLDAHRKRWEDWGC
jgi:radical SAM superfamily enzyme YgiQ (UPF0313 family)